MSELSKMTATPLYSSALIDEKVTGNLRKDYLATVKFKKTL